MTSTSKPRHEWRRNVGVAHAFPTHRFYDLYVGDQYQHTWLREDTLTGKFDLARAGMTEYIGEFGSIQDAEDHLIALDVVERFERAYG